MSVNELDGQLSIYEVLGLPAPEPTEPVEAPNPTPVILESPYAGDVATNVAYARAALRDSLLRGEAPIASHLLYTQPGVLDDDDPAERRLGINAGLAWGIEAALTVVYTDLGISTGMRYGIARAQAENRPIEHRTILPAGALPIF